MSIKNGFKRTLLCAAVVALCATMSIESRVFAQSGMSAASQFKNPSTATNPKPYGKTIGEWSAEWWKWVYSIPADENPLTDFTGEFCDVGQPAGKVWFLAGTFGLTGVVRDECVVPKTKALFFPILNTAWIDCPANWDEGTGACCLGEFGACDGDGLTEMECEDQDGVWLGPDQSCDDCFTNEELRVLLSGNIDLGCQLTCTVDGEAVSSLQIPMVRSQSPLFTGVFSEDNVFDGGCGIPSPAGPYDRAISDGYWVMLPPLSPGEHTIDFHGAACAPDLSAIYFEVGVTYVLTVE